MIKPSTPEFDQYADRLEEDMRQAIPAAFAEGPYFTEYKILHVAHRCFDREVTSFLDFGCGIGDSLNFARTQFPNAEIWGYDASPKCIDLARQRARIAKLTSNLDDLPKGRFDVVFAANVFHHIPCADRKEAMARCKSLLKSDGRMFLFEHNPLNPVTRKVFERCCFDRGAVMLARRELLALAQVVGLKIGHAPYTLFFPRQLAFLRPIERMLGWLPLGAQYCVEMVNEAEILE
jgi:2-polyprenyl-3-methyl-5-hydroxy-6-metoxy-1,4-benzoquinol methylase